MIILLGCAINGESMAGICLATGKQIVNKKSYVQKMLKQGVNSLLQVHFQPNFA